MAVIRPLTLAPPTPTPLPQFSIAIGLSAYYDQNNNHAPDIDEGIAGISVRILDLRTNRLLTHVFTNEEGYASVPRKENLSSNFITSVFWKPVADVPLPRMRKSYVTYCVPFAKRD